MKHLVAGLAGFSTLFLAGFDNSTNPPFPTLTPSSLDFTLAGSVLKERDISTISRGDHSLGILASDEGAVIQVLSFAPDGTGATIRENLSLAELDDLELDLEASTFLDGWYYVLGSHGAAKKSGVYAEPRARMFRFRLRPGSPGATDLQSTTLTPLLSVNPTLSPYHRRSLQQKGINIEGLAGRGEDLYIGLRSPNLDGDAFIIRMGADALFSEAQPAYDLLKVHLGQGLGIRGMTPVRDGFLLIAGNAGSESGKRYPRTEDYAEDRLSALFFWRPGNRNATAVGLFPRTEKGKEEALLVLSDDPAGPADVLVLYDSIRGGGARCFAVNIPDDG